MAKYKDPKVRVAKPYAGARRVMRNPAHPFKLRTKPYQIQPCMISPVLPGETMKNLVHMSRVVTKPIKDPLVGWWYENYVFYVRLRDIEFHLKDTKGEWLNEMVTSPGTFDPTPLRSATALQAFYSSANSIPWANTPWKPSSSIISAIKMKIGTSPLSTICRWRSSARGTGWIV